MWPLLLAASFSVGYGCIPTESPDDRPNIPGVFPTTQTVPGAITSTLTISTSTPTTSPASTTTSSTTTTTSTTTSTTTTTTTTTLPDCPMGYTMFTDPTSMTTSCYYVSPFPVAEAMRLRWAEARTECMLVGGDLAVITTTTENDFVSSLANIGVPTSPAPSVTSAQVWIGGSCTTNCRRITPNWELNWMYLDGTPIDPTWAPWIQITQQQPNDCCPSCLSLLTNNNLFTPTPTTGVGYWHDLLCGNPGRYACEIPWPPPPG